MIIPMVRYASQIAGVLPLYDVVSGTAPEFYQDEDKNWEIVFKKDCEISFRRLPPTVEIFAVGCGENGKQAPNIWYDRPSGVEKARAVAGDGGKGGACVTETKALKLYQAYRVTIGNTAVNTGDTYAFGVTAAYAGGASGGAGAKRTERDESVSNATAGNGTDGVLAFGVGSTQYEGESVIKFGAGGGGGGAIVNDASGYGLNKADPGTGGATGGGAGGNQATGVDATPNTGGGGGGGAARATASGGPDYYAKMGGAGGSGIVIMRNIREENES